MSRRVSSPACSVALPALISLSLAARKVAGALEIWAAAMEASVHLAFAMAVRMPTVLSSNSCVA